jgi:hypothetical protein
VHPRLVATALHDWCDAGALLRCREAVAVFAKGHEKARSKRGPSAEEGIEEFVVGLSWRERGSWPTLQEVGK